MIYAWRNWFVGVLGLLVLSVVMQRQEFPSYLVGIPGMNPFNLLLLSTVAAWAIHLKGQGRGIDMPQSVKLWFILVLIVLFVTYFRAVIDLKSIPHNPFLGRSHRRPSTMEFTGEFVINRIKFVFPALLLFDACRTRRRILIAIGVILFCALSYSVLVIKHVPISTLWQGDYMKYRHRIDRDIGLMAIDMSMLLAAAFWAGVCATILVIRKKWQRLLMGVPLAAMFLAMALCHSRGSYLGFVAAGLVLAIARWRILLPIIPIAAIVLCSVFPSIADRMLMGVGLTSATGDTYHDMEEITAGRFTDLWPAAIEQIGKSPLIGYGALACQRTELRDKWLEVAGAPTHPHNAYLELLLDMGVFGAVPVLVVYFAILAMTWKLFRQRKDKTAAGIGGMGLAAIVVLLVTAMGAQSFYPTQSTILSWCMWALAMRMTLDMRRRPAKAHLYDPRLASDPRRSFDGRTPAPRQHVTANLVGPR